ncbi:hypothetical protein AVEN_149828-1, partial [Araneus ventricosus]
MQQRPNSGDESSSVFGIMNKGEQISSKIQENCSERNIPKDDYVLVTNP